MAKILLANLGNRNIIYKGKTYPDFDKELKAELGTFREWTESLLLNFENKKDFLDLNILDSLLNSMIGEIGEIILFYSDQEANQKNDQDTIYEAKIVKNLIKSKYNFENVNLIAVKASVVDNEGLVRFYRNQIRHLKNRETKDNYFIICDAGGTAQQKQALKIIAEFLLDESEFEVKYINPNGTIDQVSQLEYRNIIVTEQAINLIQHGLFSAAAQLLGIRIENVNLLDIKGKLLCSLIHRYNSNQEGAISLLKSIQKISIDKFQEYKEQKVQSLNVELKEFFGKKYLILTDKLYKAIFLNNKKLFSESILAFAQFYELFFVLSISQPNLKILYGSPSNPQLTEQQKLNLKEFFDHNYQSYLEQRKDFNPAIGNINTQVMILKKSENESVKKIAIVLSPHIEWTDDCGSNGGFIVTSIRNKIAHKGLYIDQDKMSKEYSSYEKILEQCHSILQLTERDLFQDLADLLEQNFRQ
ncbi:MAG TPA: hypothetical protein PK622_12855 [Saprospiraceae bacterium]|nr:hypothetical protein [Saprospiraceae bacterium]